MVELANILGVRIDNLTKKEILQKVNEFILQDKFHQIATINPEFVLEAQKNPEFKKILNSCDLNVADGFGIKYAFWQYGKNLKCRMAGTDLMLEILEMTNRNGLKIFLAAKKEGLSSWQETRDSILRLHPNLNISGDNIDTKNPNYKLPVTNYDAVFCNFGAPAQELFINSVKNDNIRLAMGVGGSFDFLTGKVKRAPLFFRRGGLEWLWRLGQPQPWKFKKERLKRIFRAVIIFPVKIIFSK